MLGFHHIRSRARAAEGLEPFPSRNAWKRYLDYLMYAVGVLSPLALLPQIGSIYLNHATEGVSIETWLLLCLFNLLWINYGIVHGDKPIIISHSLFAVFNVIIVAGVLMY